jgi:hypothetical protein
MMTRTPKRYLHAFMTRRHWQRSKDFVDVDIQTTSVGVEHETKYNTISVIDANDFGTSDMSYS